MFLNVAMRESGCLRLTFTAKNATITSTHVPCAEIPGYYSFERKNSAITVSVRGGAGRQADYLKSK